MSAVVSRRKARVAIETRVLYVYTTSYEKSTRNVWQRVHQVEEVMLVPIAIAAKHRMADTLVEQTKNRIAFGGRVHVACLKTSE